MKRHLKNLSQPTSILPLVIFRIAFGVLMFISMLRFILNGWVTEFYGLPQFHFTYIGFDWVKPLPEAGMYLVYFALLGLSLLITFGAFYRVSMIAFFILFTYVELIDISYYLNHYYFISLLSFLLIFLPLNRKFAFDSWRNPQLEQDNVPLWTIAVIRFQIGLVYFFAGIAKLNPDWLLHAQPMQLWLPARVGSPLIGPLFDTDWFAYLLSWGGALFDLSIALLLIWRITRPFAYLMVVFFHIMTAILFNIGMFPWIMIVCTWIFFTPDDYAFVLKRFRKRLSTPKPTTMPYHQGIIALLAIFFLLQILMPFRHLLYPGNVNWTEEGFRFSWRVMLVEKTGHVTFSIHEPTTNKKWTVFPADHLTRQQEKQMAFQPDMILQFAHYLATLWEDKGYPNVAVYGEAYVSWNGRASQLLIDTTVDLSQEARTLLAKDWLLPNGNE